MTQLRSIRASLLSKSALRSANQLLCMGEYAKAEVAYRASLAGVPRKYLVDAQVGHAMALTMTGRHVEGAVLCEEVLPQVRGLQRSQMQVTLAQCRARLGELPLAFAIWRAVIADGDSLPKAVAHACLGEELLRVGDISSATPHLQSALASSHPEAKACAQASIGHIFAVNGQLVQARSYWHSARRSRFLSASTQADFYAAVQLTKEGNLIAAKELLNSVVEVGYPDAAADARKQLQIIENGEQA